MGDEWVDDMTTRWTLNARTYLVRAFEGGGDEYEVKLEDGTELLSYVHTGFSEPLVMLNVWDPHVVADAMVAIIMHMNASFDAGLMSA
jgi:hypothetical protein